MDARWIIGLASGSSADGVDAALLEVEGVGLEMRVRLAQSLHQSYGPELQEMILRAASPGNCETKQVSLLHRLLGETFAAAARQVADRASLSLQKVQCIACPGHTLWHEPEGRFPSTLPVGMATVVAERTGVTTVHDFRSRDMAAGGQGAPLVGLADFIMLRHADESRLLIHLGGVARVVFLRAGCRVHDILGFEVGPCNVLLDALMRQLTGGRENYDTGGKHAVQGRCLPAVLESWLKHPHLQRRPPRSLPGQTFGKDFAVAAIEQGRQAGGSGLDVLCTATHFVAQNIAQSLRRFLLERAVPARVLISGGGTRNGLLWRLLEQQFPKIPAGRTDSVGIPAEAYKAAASGILGTLTIDGVPANIPSATGATVSRLLGSLTPGSTINWARCLAWMADLATPVTAMYDI